MPTPLGAGGYRFLGPEEANPNMPVCIQQQPPPTPTPARSETPTCDFTRMTHRAPPPHIHTPPSKVDTGPASLCTEQRTVSTPSDLSSLFTNKSVTLTDLYTHSFWKRKGP